VAGFSQGGSEAGDLALFNPRGVAVRADGTLIVADSSHLLAIDAAGKVTAIAGNGDFDFTPGPAAQTGFADPTMLGLDRAGNLYVLDSINRGIRKVTPAGQTTSLFESIQAEDPSADTSIDQLAVAPDGTLYFTTKTQTDDHYTLYSLQAGGKPQVVLALDNAAGLSSGSGIATYGIATDAAGALYVAQFAGLKRRSPAGAWEVLGDDDAWRSGFRPLVGMAIDAKGRLYAADTEGNAVWRYDPAAKRWSLVAGKGAANLAGNGVDDSLSGPGYPTFAPNGDLYVSDPGHKQVKRIPADKL
jgi:sugar lactone lactonase YvrE